MPSPLKTWWAKPWARWPVMVLLAVGLLLAGAWFYLNVSGRRAWRNVSAQLAAEGEVIDLPALLWPDVPEGANFCAREPLRDWAAGARAPKDLREKGRKARDQIKDILALSSEAQAARAFHGVQQGRPMELAKLANALRKGNPPWMPGLPGEPAHDVTAGLTTKWDPLFAQLAEGLICPQAQWMPPLSSQLEIRPFGKLSITHLKSVSELAQALVLGAAVSGQTGDFRTAIICLQLADRLAEASSYEPLAVNLLSAYAIEEMIANAVWELTYVHAGTPSEWATLERLLTKVDLGAMTLRAARGQLALYVDGIQFDRDLAHRTGEDTMLSDGMPASDYVPRGFYDATAADLASRSLQHVIRPLREGGLAAGTRSYRELATGGKKKLPPWSFPARISGVLLDQLVNSLGRAVHTQAVLNQAAIACVLERVRAATGSYPGSLAGLTLSDGGPLPPDPVTGTAMSYRPTDDGRYVLWSIGVDGVDHLGKRGPLFQEPTNPYYIGDWVWSYEP